MELAAAAELGLVMVLAETEALAWVEMGEQRIIQKVPPMGLLIAGAAAAVEDTMAMAGVTSKAPAMEAVG